MSTLSYIILFTFLGSVVALIGGLLLLLKEKFAIKISHFLASFAAGVLLGTSFFDLLPEALESSKGLGGETNIFLWSMIGLLTFFLLERFIRSFHHHHEHKNGEKTKSDIPLIVLGDSVHNFIDGVLIAASFLVSIPTGIATAFAVAAHEIPQEIGDFGILLHRGLSKARVLWVNFFSAAVSIFGAILTFILGESLKASLPIFLAITAGFFIYIAASDLIPEIHGEDRQNVAFWETILLILGVVSVWIIVAMLKIV